jgi:hypothetical protein
MDSEMGRACSTQWGDVKYVQNFGQKRPLARPRLNGRISYGILNKQDKMVWNGFIWIRIGTGGRLL